MSNQDCIAKIKSSFDADFYNKTYLKGAYEDMDKVFEHYLNQGALLGYDPHKNFSEILYRVENPDIQNAILSRNIPFGFYHYILFGRTEGRTNTTFDQAERLRCIIKNLDIQFIYETYKYDKNKYISGADYYYIESDSAPISPNASFSESNYRDQYDDVVTSIKNGQFLSGYEHYLQTIHVEHRIICAHEEYKEYLHHIKQEETQAKVREILEKNFPGISHPVAFDEVYNFEFSTQHDNIYLNSIPQKKTLYVLVPNFLPEILFGGYLAFYSFIENLKKNINSRVVLIVFNGQDTHLNKWNAIRMRESKPSIYHMFDEILFYEKTREIRVSSYDNVLSYSAETHYLAHNLAKYTQHQPIFFIQEFEPDFHHSGAMYSHTLNAFKIKHIGVYNSAKLLEFFKGQNIIANLNSYDNVSFENHIKKIPFSRVEFENLHKNKNRRKLIVYGRPESHAARNHFSTIIVSLKKALSEGVLLPSEWDFYAIGSLDSNNDIELALGKKLKLLRKMPLDDYEKFLSSGDIGISVISTPHPGIIHFQMAAFGLTTLTNFTDTRSIRWLQSVNKNLIGIELCPSSIVQGLKVAREEAQNINKRYTAASKMPYFSEKDCVKEAIDYITKKIS